MADKTEYKVVVCGTTVSVHKTVEAAEHEAKQYLDDYNPEDVSVYYSSFSGTEHSQMRVWPTAGQMYSKHR